VLDDVQAAADLGEALGKAGIAQEQVRSDRERVGQHVLDLVEVLALQFGDGAIQLP
jgi:hypothetical protein